MTVIPLTFADRIMSISYTLRESFSGFRRTKLSSILAIFTVWIALVLLGLFVILSVNTQRYIQSLRDRVEMDAFLQQDTKPEELAEIQSLIGRFDGVKHVTYISKEDAARIFKEEFGDDIHRVFEGNPLPSSFKVQLKTEYATGVRAKELSKNIGGIAGIDTVVYHETLLEILDTKTATIYKLSLGLGLFVALSAILLVANTIRLAIFAKRHIVRTMDLVGATRMFIKLPFYVEGILQGFLGGLLAGGLLYLLIEYLLKFVSPELCVFVHMPMTFYGGVAAAGVVLGLLGSLLSVGRFLPKLR